MELDEAQDFDQLLQRMARTSFQARNLGRAADVLELMFSEPHNLVVLTISGALTVAQQGSIFMEQGDTELEGCGVQGENHKKS